MTATIASVVAAAAALGPQASAAGRAGGRAASAGVSLYDATADTPFHSFLKHPELAVACDDSRYQPPSSGGGGGGGAHDAAAVVDSPCSIHAKVIVGRWTQHFLKLRSRTLMSGKMSGPSADPNDPRFRDIFTLRNVLPRHVVGKLRSATAKGLHVDGILLTVTYPVNSDDHGNPVPLTYKTASFSVGHTVETPGMNSCWMVVNQPPPVGFQLGFADPHGHLCPGY